MPNQLIFSLLVFFLTAVPTAVCSAPVLSDVTGSSPTETQLNIDIKTAIEEGSKNPGTRFHLRTTCTYDNRIRGVELYSNGVAVWKNRTQFQASESIRSGLLKLLLAERFYDLAPNYGGKHGLVRPKVGFKITCQIWLDIGGLQKLTVQQADGTQSSRLIKLATALLDRLEPLVKDGTSAKDLQDGLTKVENYELATQAFKLRLIELPLNSSAESGYILRIADGFASRQDYSPGKKIGTQTQVQINRCDLAQLTLAIQSADMAGFPVNLWSDSQIELEVAVLSHKKSVLARPFSRLRDKAQGVEQQRFNELMDVLRSFDPQIRSVCVR